MNVDDLKNKIEVLRYNKNYYSLHGEDVFGVNLIRNSPDTWTFYNLDQRGEWHDVKIFNDEFSACNHMYEVISR